MEFLRNVIRFNTPGDFSKWEQECLPIGNSYMGASFFGGIVKEKIVLNEKTLWTGGPSKWRPDYYGGNKKNAYPHVKRVQELLHDGKYEEALKVLPELTGLAEGSGAYQLLGNLYLEKGIDEKAVTDYRRELNMDTGVFGTSFRVNGILHSRLAFANYPSNVICIAISADTGDSRGVNAVIYLGEYQNGTVRAEGNSLYLQGEVPDNQMRYGAEFRVETVRGTVTAKEDRLEISHADMAVIYLTAGTDYSPDFSKGYRSGVDPMTAVRERLDRACAMGWKKLYEEHTDDYTPLFNRCRISLNDAGGEPLPADELVKGYKNGDVQCRSMLEELYFQFGRYMLISSSRSGSLPANLQGVWNESNTPPWNCDYHINVNLQMNYWGAYNTNLAETAKPLVDFLDDLRPAGRITAKEYYGIESDEQNPENGWTAHTAVNIFGWTAPGWDFYWGWSTAAVAWLMQNIWEYYEFTGDKEYLEQRIYPIMLESVKFYSQWLIYDDKQDRLVSTPTYSPEHGPVTVGNTYEQSLIEQLYRDFIRASEILGKDSELREKIKHDVELLKPYHVGKTGLIKEWFEEDDPDFDRSKIQPNHRHVSHLMGLYPGKAVTHDDPELIKGAINTLNHRGDESTGWARAYKLNLWARTRDGNRAYSIFSGLLSDCTFVNLFDFHPPFQLDGNFGGSAGVAEMLLQSHEGYVYPLAALPDAWQEGCFEGLCARNGFVLDAQWSEKKLTRLTVKSTLGGELKIKCGASSVTSDGKEVSCTREGELLIVNTEKNGNYEFVF